MDSKSEVRLEVLLEIFQRQRHYSDSVTWLYKQTVWKGIVNF